MIKKAKNDGKTGDPKDLLKDIQNFQVELNKLLRHKNHKVPVIFSQVKILSDEQGGIAKTMLTVPGCVGCGDSLDVYNSDRSPEH